MGLKFIYKYVKKVVIGVIDSGIGGASILKAIKNVLPNEKFVYLVDAMNAPYGDKTKNEILEITKKNVEFLIKKHHIKMLVIACNTASSVCGNVLREYVKMPIICVEPPIKPALENNYKKILVLATPRTLKSNLIIKKYCKTNKQIEKLAIVQLATKIDESMGNFESLTDFLDEKLREYKDCDAVVIGCTHYNFIKKEIGLAMPNAKIISCEKAVANRTKQVFEREFNNESDINRLNKGLKKVGLKKLNPTKIVLTKQNKEMLKFLTNYLN